MIELSKLPLFPLDKASAPEGEPLLAAFREGLVEPPYELLTSLIDLSHRLTFLLWAIPGLRSAIVPPDLRLVDSLTIVRLVVVSLPHAFPTIPPPSMALKAFSLSEWMLMRNDTPIPREEKELYIRKHYNRSLIDTIASIGEMHPEVAQTLPVSVRCLIV